MPEVHSVGGVLVHMPHVCSVRNVDITEPETIQHYLACVVTLSMHT